MDRLILILLLAMNPLSLGAVAIPKAAAPVLVAMKAELERNLAALKVEPEPPNFLSYEVNDRHLFHLRAGSGALETSTETRTRVLDIDIRVGGPQLDNTHPLRSAGGLDWSGMTQNPSSVLPLEDDLEAMRSEIWFQTDHAFRKAQEQFGKVRTNMKLSVAEEDPSADFAPAPVVEAIESPRDLMLDRALWAAKLERYTRPFRDQPAIEWNVADLQAEANTLSYVNSEGSLLQLPRTALNLVLSAHLRAQDGMALSRTATFFAPSADQLPTDAVVLARVAAMIKELLALREAPVTDPFTGPAMLSGRAACVYFHEVFGHRAEGHRQKGADSGQTLKKLVGQKLLPESLSVASDPTLERFGAIALAGHYRFDDEGVLARRVPLVEQGVLKGFMMNRAPIAGFPASNGHGRKSPGRPAVARQANLMVTSAAPVTRAQLKDQLLAQVRKQDKPYGLLFDDIEGGFTLTGRVIPNAFNVRPVMVYRVYPDGREQLVRGVDLIGTPLESLTQILASDDQPDVFNGVCGAESGLVPVSAVAPGLLLGQVEVQKKEKNQELPPILPAPADLPAER